MKTTRTAALLLALMLCLSLCPAYADVIWEPNDDFYLEHYENCTHVDRSFTALEDVKLYETPLSDRVVCTIAKGTKLLVSFVYDPTDYGYVQFTEEKDGSIQPSYAYSADGYSYKGWVDMSKMELVYDNISFIEEHQNEFYTYEGSYEGIAGGQNIVLWTYPNSGSVSFVMEEMPEALAEYGFSHAYKDADGKEWGYISYLYGIRSVWVCIDDPTGEHIAVAAPEDTQDVHDAIIDEPVRENAGFPYWLLAIALVAVVAIVTIVILRKFYKKK